MKQCRGVKLCDIYSICQANNELLFYISELYLNIELVLPSAARRLISRGYLVCFCLSSLEAPIY